MAKVEKMSMVLTVDMAAGVREAVASGEYASNSEVVRDALRDWQLKRTLRRTEIESLRGLWEEGLASGTEQFSDMDAIRQEARKRLAQSKP